MAVAWVAARAWAQEDIGRSLMSTEKVLDTYSELTGRTLLRPGLLPPLSESILSEISTNTSGRSNAVASIERELKENDLEIVPDRGLFVWVLPPGLRRSPVAPILARIKRPAPRTNNVAAGELIPAGTIDFRQAPLDRVVGIYAAFRNRTVLRPSLLPSWPASFYNRTALTRDELLYAFNVVLVLNGVGTVDDGEKFTEVVPLKRLAGIQPRAPIPEPGAKLIDPVQTLRTGPGAGSTETELPLTVDRLTR